MYPLIVVAIFFILSLLGAVILFKFFKSSALIQGKTYQAGGAIAGFIILYVLLYHSYAKIDDFQGIKNENNELKEKYQIQTITGNLKNYNKKYAKIVLAVRETEPDINGKYRLKAPGINPEEDDIRIYVITKDRQDAYYILSKEEMDDFEIDLGN